MFKLYSDSFLDRPILVCDVCDQPITDIWGDKATATPSRDGHVNPVTIHHAACTPQAGSVTMSLIEFLKLLAVQNRIGDLGSDGGIDTVHVQYPTGGRFEA